MAKVPGNWCDQLQLQVPFQKFAWSEYLNWVSSICRPKFNWHCIVTWQPICLPTKVAIKCFKQINNKQILLKLTACKNTLAMTEVSGKHTNPDVKKFTIALIAIGALFLANVLVMLFLKMQRRFPDKFCRYVLFFSTTSYLWQLNDLKSELINPQKNYSPIYPFGS